MRRLLLLAVFLILPTHTGCAPSDLLFGALDNYYSGGGTTSTDRRYHYDRQQEAWDSYNRYGNAL